MIQDTSSAFITAMNAKMASGNTPDTLHPMYIKYQKHLELVDDVYEGGDDIKKYLFRFPQEIQSTFETRQDRATLRNFVHRAASAFLGMIYRKPIEIDGYPGTIERIMKKIDTRNDITEFSKQVTNAVIRHSKAYILVDSPSAMSNVANRDPYFVLIERPGLINWRKDIEGNFTMCVIVEVVSVPHGEFGTKFIQQWRHYTDDGMVRVYRNSRQDGTSKQFDSDKPLGNGFYLAEPPVQMDYIGIPMVEISIGDIPLLYDVAHMNIKHYNRQSHKDRYLTMAALPIPVIWGADIDDDGNTTTAKPALVIGVDEAFIFTGAKDESDFQWRELSGTSIELLENDLNSITEDITTGILRAAETANAVQKTATEVALLQAEASNRVSNIAISVENGIIDALKIMAVFTQEKITNKAIFNLSNDFNAALSGTDGARIVMESYLMGLVSIETFLNAMSEAELINIDSAVKELERIKLDTFKPVPKAPLPSSTDNKMKGAADEGVKKKESNPKDNKKV